MLADKIVGWVDFEVANAVVLIAVALLQQAIELVVMQSAIGAHPRCCLK